MKFRAIVICRLHACVNLLLLLLAWAATTERATGQLPDPNQGPGGPILVVTSSSATYGKYFAEILRTEGLNEFAVVDIGAVSATTLNSYDVVILAPLAVNATQVTMFTNWVNAGGNLIAMRPDAPLDSLLGLTSTAGTLSNAYLAVSSSTLFGNGIVNKPMQFHGSAKIYNMNGASTLATLYSNATTPTPNPAITIRQVGSNGGNAVAFAFDLATSIVYTRQGNPAWAAQERDGLSPIRSDDKFYGAAAGDPQPDWTDLTNLVAIPQADEQQRLLANLVLRVNLRKKPLPRFWYLPFGKKAAVVMTGDDHANGGTAPRFEQFLAASNGGCNVANWECIRGTSYIYVEPQNLSDAQAASYTAQGFEVGLHINTNCGDYSPTSLNNAYTQQIAAFRSAYPSIPPPITERHHCIAWSDWAQGAKTQLQNNMRLDTSYYFWPPGWAQDRPGHFTGSAMPMRFADLDGTIINVYNLPSQMTDESGQTFPFTSDALLSAAVGAEGFYGVYTVNAHTDAATSQVANAVVSSARSRDVPVVSSVQMLTWLDARNSSSFTGITWNGTALGFTVAPGTGANGLRAMIPAHSGTGVLTGISGPGGSVPLSISTIKGIDFAMFSAPAGSYTATYAADTTRPTITTTSPGNNATGVNQNASVTATFSEAMDPSTIHSTSFELRDSGNAVVPASIVYDPSTRVASLTPNSPLAASATYSATVTTTVKDLLGNAIANNNTWTFSTVAGPTCPCSVWNSSATPASPTVNDPNAVELGVKLRSDLNGFISGIRFYKGASNTGTHVGSLWTTGGQLLASATFANETASGWQQVNFSTPVAITANTVYVASYHTNTGFYSANSAFFASSGVDNSPLHVLQNGVNGGNGVYAYGASSQFPSNTFQSTNYWVDVVFTLGSGPPQLSITSTNPTGGAPNVNIGTTVSATFNNTLNASTVTSSTFTLREGTNTITGTYNVSGNTATFTPASALTPSRTYTVTITTGVRDTNGSALASDQSWQFTTAAGSSACTNPANAIVAENCLTGNLPSEWDVSGAGDSTIQGFTTDISVNVGGTVSFKINTPASTSRLDIYRMGYYGGNGARKIATVNVTSAQNQPACLTNAATGLIDCGNWNVSATWTVPANATSGVYFAKAVRGDNGGASHIFFIVRNDASKSDILFQTSDTTWQAYNDYGGNSLYTGGPGTNPGRAYKVSYNRPFRTRVVEPETWVFNAEYPMIRWLEANGYDVSYFSGVDTERNAALIRNHKVWMSNGHDEYYSAGQRSSVEGARDAGINLAFFSGNTMFWKTRWENSIDGANTPFRTLVSYKETHANAKIDPIGAAVWTGTWRDPRFSPPADGGRPENAVMGTLFRINGPVTATITVPQAAGRMRFWRNTSVATLGTGQVATLAPGTIGAEVNVDEDNGFRPAGLFELSNTPFSDQSNFLQDYGSTYGPGSGVHKLTLYKAPSGARVFSAGTYQWAWGLDSNHDRSDLGNTTDARMQQATVNLFADMGVQPTTLQTGLTPAVASSDATAPSSTITSPTAGSTIPTGTAVTITGTATEAGGGLVAAVEVSVDAGATWHPAVGRESWSYSWTPTTAGSVTIKSRAVDDSGNPEVAGAGVNVTVGSGGGTGCTTNCTIWPSTTVPGVVDQGPDNSVELGVRFRSDVNGTITGIRFYKSTANTGTHIGSLWSASGQSLASATFSSETASGWQQVNFATPVAITANTDYIASYHVNAGHYSQDLNYFTNAGVDRPPLHALRSGVSGPNGVYAYGSTSTFPSQTFNGANYWVDVVFNAGSAPTLSSIAVTPSNPSIPVGATQPFTATGTYSDGSTQNITGNVTWASATTTVATITSAGVATGVSAGTSNISATSGSISGSTTLTVTSAPAQLTITTSTLPNGTIGTAYSATLAASGGVTPYTWAITTGALPGGLTLNASSGAISGTPSTAGTTTFTVQVTDSATPAGSATKSLSITIGSGGGTGCTPNCTIWPTSTVPGVVDQGPDSPVELGVRFRSDVNGSITGIRFYKSTANTGTHVGNLWSASGQLLASATFTSETASGWQQVNFATPVAITANTDYIASYHVNTGHYSQDLNYFTNSGFDRPPLHALRSGVSGANGLYAYGSTSTFPSQTFNGANYWIDVVFQ